MPDAKEQFRMDKNLELDVIVMSSSKTYFLGKAKSVSSKNKVGPFDVLPMHENFISMLYDKVTVVKPGGEKEEIACEHGILEVSENRVRVFLGI